MLSLLLVLTVLGCQPPRDESAPPAPAAPTGTAADEAKKGAKAAEAGQPLAQKEKWNMAHAEEAWGVTFKSLKVIRRGAVAPPDKSPRPPIGPRYELLFEMKKNLTGDELKSVKATLTGGKGDVEIVLLDADNVVVGKFSGFDFEVGGEITGVKGDAFRLLLGPAPASVVRAEMRPVRKSS